MEWMELILSRFEQPGVWAVPLETAFKSLLLMGLAFATVRLLGRRSAALRQTLWSAALVGLLVLPVLLVAGPEWRVTVAEEMAASPPAAAGEATPIAVRAQAPPSLPAPQGPSGTWLLIVYGAGVTVVLIRWLAGVVALKRRLRTCRPVRELAWRHDICSLGRRLGIRQSVRLRQSGDIRAPLTWGVLSPVILLPAEALSWPSSVRRTVLLHELIHVRRRDLLIENLTQFACALYWFNPLVWLAARQQRLEREKACDDAVLAQGTRPSDYARQLLYMAVRTRAERVSVGVSMAGRRQLEGRLVSILDPQRRRNTALPTLAGALLAAAAVVVPLAAFSPVTELIPAPLRVAAPLEPQRRSIGHGGLQIEMDAAEIVNGEVKLEVGGWFRVEAPGSPSRVVELRRPDTGPTTRIFLVDGQEQTWGAEADALLQQGVAAGEDMQRAYEEMGRVHEELAHTHQEMDQAHSRLAEARHELEQHQLDIEQRTQQLHQQLQRHAQELEQARHEMLQQHQARRHELQEELQRATEDRRTQMAELQRALEELELRREEASGQQRAEIERLLTERRDQLAKQQQMLSELHQRRASEVQQHMAEMQHNLQAIEEQQAARLADARRRLNESRGQMSQQLAQARQDLTEAERRLAQAEARLEERREEVSTTLRELLLQTVREMGLAPDEGDTELIAATAAGLSRAGSLRITDGGWTFEAHEDVLRDLAVSLAGRLSGLTETQQDELADRIVERLAIVSGN